MHDREIKKPFHLYAPNIHTGGGMVLLLELLKQRTIKFVSANLDIRIKAKFISDTIQEVNFVSPTLVSRVIAEIKLWFSIKHRNQIVLCFHGLPPLLPSRGKVIVFVQNRLIFEKNNYTHDTWIKIRLLLEKLWYKIGHRKEYQYIVQTDSMQKLLLDFLGDKSQLIKLPFVPRMNISNVINHDKIYDFLYVASGEDHKNHINLLKAWQILKADNLSPKLALTVCPKKYPKIANLIESYRSQYNLNLVNLGEIKHGEISALYSSSKNFIYPSLVESFGVPLLEAKAHGLPIIASELDYVRDVVSPYSTFDPHSSISIARAVKRHLGIDNHRLEDILSAEEFLTKLTPQI